nr:hypothetical protein [Tanacetum cinerariifolium]
MIVYLKNMARYKIAHFKGMTYDHVRPIFEREHNNVQTFLKPDRDEDPTKKKVAKETLLQESFKKLRAEVEVSGSHSTHDTPTDDPKEMFEEDVNNMLQIVLLSKFKVEALQVKYPLINWEIHSEGSRSYWKIIRGSCDEDLHGGQQTKEQKKFGYILKVIKKLELKKLDDLLEKSLRDYCCWFKSYCCWFKIMLLSKADTAAEETKGITLIHYDMFGMYILEKMFKDLGYMTGMLLFMHFRIPQESLDEGLLSLMSEEDMTIFLEYVPRFREVEVYIETSVSLVERHMMKRMTSKGKAKLIEEIVDHDVSDAVGKEFDAHSRNSDKLSLEMEELLYYDTNEVVSISRKSDVPTWFSDEDVDQAIDVE